MPLSRRELLQSAALAAAGLALPRAGLAALRSPAQPARLKVLKHRIAHITDIHIQPERAAAAGLAACLKHLRELTPRIDLVLTGGDLVMDSFSADEARTRTQWDLLTKTLADECPIPIRHTLGNHDIWGFNKTKSKTTGNERLWGKKWAMELLGMARPYHAHDLAEGSVKGGTPWRVIHLDSVRPEGDGYKAFLDEEQLAWLKQELAATPKSTAILVVSHIPILSFSALFDSKADQPVRINPATSHADARTLHEMFVGHGNVRLCISGHIHQQDEGLFQGVAYRCNGAVSGNWWKPGGDRSLPGYTILNLFDDGSWENHYTPYGWTMHEK